MKKLIAIVKLKGTQNIEKIEREYETKKEFYADLRSNGYRVRKIYTEEEFNKL